MYLATIGGHTAEDTTRRVMKQVLDNKLAQMFNWAGKGEKHAFGQLILKDVVIGRKLYCINKKVHTGSYAATIKEKFYCFI